MTPFEQYRLSQHLMKWILVSHSPQHDLPQFSDPQVPPANSKLSQLQAWTPSQWSLFSLVLPILDVWHWTPTKLFLSIQNLSSMLQCHVAMKWVWILQCCFRWIILWTSEFHHSFLGSSSKSYNWGRVHFYLQFLQKWKLWNPGWKSAHPLLLTHSSISVLTSFVPKTESWILSTSGTIKKS